MSVIGSGLLVVFSSYPFFGYPFFGEVKRDILGEMEKKELVGLMLFFALCFKASKYE